MDLKNELEVERIKLDLDGTQIMFNFDLESKNIYLVCERGRGLDPFTTPIRRWNS